MFHQRNFSRDHSKIDGENGDKGIRIEPTSHKTDNFPRGLIPREVENL